MIPLGVLGGARHAARAGAEFAYLGGGETASGTSATLTVTNLDLGEEAPDRAIVALIGRRVAQGRALVSVTIGGVEATIDAKSPTWDSAIIARAVVPTGTTGDVAITLNGTEAGPRYVDLYAHYGPVVVLSASSAYSSSTKQTSTTVNPAKEGGHLLAVAHSSSPAQLVTWTWDGHPQAGSRDAASSHVSHISTPSIASGSQTVAATSSAAMYQGLAAVVYGPPAVLTSDSFNRADGELNGTYSDAALGGTPLLWYNNASYVIESNQLRSTNYLARWATVNTGVSNMAVSVTVATLGPVYITASGASNDARGNRYAARIDTDGSLTLEVEYAGTYTLGTASAGTVTTGSVVTLTSLNKDLDVSVNGVSVIAATDSVSGFLPGTYAGIRSSSNTWRLDDFKVETR